MTEGKKTRTRLPRNVWAVGAASFFTDVSSEMIANLLPLFLVSLKVRITVIGLIEGFAEAVASIVKIFSGWISDRLGARKWLAVAGYGFSSLSKIVYYFASTWGWIAGARWGDRLGKGIRTAPRDALVADSVPSGMRGHAFGFHRAADTAGAFVGLGIALFLVWKLQGTGGGLKPETFRTLVLVSLVPAFLAVISLAIGARDVPLGAKSGLLRLGFRGLGRNFAIFCAITAVFELGNSSDAFLILLARERGLSTLGILAMLVGFNFVYALLSTPAGKLSDRVGRKAIISWGWGFYGCIYLGMALSRKAAPIVVLYILYGCYYGLTYGTAKAFVTDLVRPEHRGIAFGTYNAVLGITDLPASLIAGLLWNGVGSWRGLGASAPFLFGAAMALAALGMILVWRPQPPS